MRAPARAGAKLLKFILKTRLRRPYLQSMRPTRSGPATRETSGAMANPTKNEVDIMALSHRKVSRDVRSSHTVTPILIKSGERNARDAGCAMNRQQRGRAIVNRIYEVLEKRPTTYYEVVGALTL